VPITCETLLSTGTNLVSIGKACIDLTEAACGTLNYVSVSGIFSQCGFRRGQCLAKYGKLVCPVPVSAPAPSHPPDLISAPAPSPPPFAPSPTALTCETLLATGKNLQATGEWCYDLKTEAACGTLNYVPMDGTFRQCAFKNGACSAKHGHVLVCPVVTAPSPPPLAPSPLAHPVAPITCEVLLATGTNLQHTNRWCNQLTTEESCGTLNYIPMGSGFKQCGFDSGKCSAAYGDLTCPAPHP
jgi:hypothetical protein